MQRTIGAIIGAIAIGVAITGWGMARGFTPIGPFAAGLLALFLSVLVWLGLRALGRHRVLAAAAQGPYIARHSGLVWAVGLSGVLTYGMARPQFPETSGLEERFWLLALLGAVCLPIMLWGGLVFRKMLERGLGIERPDA